MMDAQGMPEMAIDMIGQTIGGYVVVERGPSWRGAHWWCLCLTCQDQSLIRGTDLRKVADGRRVWYCRTCAPEEGNALT
jgi:hypothetical protein